MSRLEAELRRVFGDPPQSPRAVVRVQVGSGQGFDAGREEADRLVDAGAELVVIDSDGPSTAALCAIAVLLDLEPVAVIGTAAADGPGPWRKQVVAVRDLVRSTRAVARDIPRLVELLDDSAFGRLVGLLDRLAARRTPALLGGGTDTAAAALVVSRLQPGADRWWLAGSVPVEAAGGLALTAAGLTPLLDLDLGPGSADLAVALVRAGLEQLGG